MLPNLTSTQQECVDRVRLYSKDTHNFVYVYFKVLVTDQALWDRLGYTISENKVLLNRRCKPLKGLTKNKKKNAKAKISNSSLPNKQKKKKTKASLAIPFQPKIKETGGSPLPKKKKAKASLTTHFQLEIQVTIPFHEFTPIAGNQVALPLQVSSPFVENPTTSSSKGPVSMVNSPIVSFSWKKRQA